MVFEKINKDNNNRGVEQIYEENKELKLINSQLEEQLQSLQCEILEYDANEEKFIQQVI